MSEDNPLLELKEIGDFPIAPAHGIAALAMNFALKYHDTAIIKDGTMYQQMKLEGSNIVPIHLDMVFDTARQFERWIMDSPNRITEQVFEAIAEGLDAAFADDPAESGDADATAKPSKTGCT